MVLAIECDPGQVPFICGDGPIYQGEEFLAFPQRQGWEMGQSESLVQLAKRAQAWLFFGLLAVVGISPDAFIASDSTSTALQVIDTSLLPALLQGSPDHPNLTLTEALATAKNVMKWEVIPLLRAYEEQEPLTLWNSIPFAVLFSIDVLMDTLVDIVRDQKYKNRRSELLFPK